MATYVSSETLNSTFFKKVDSITSETYISLIGSYLALLQTLCFRQNYVWRNRIQMFKLVEDNQYSLTQISLTVLYSLY